MGWCDYDSFAILRGGEGLCSGVRCVTVEAVIVVLQCAVWCDAVCNGVVKRAVSRCGVVLRKVLCGIARVNDHNLEKYKNRKVITKTHATVSSNLLSVNELITCIMCLTCNVVTGWRDNNIS